MKNTIRITLLLCGCILWMGTREAAAQLPRKKSDIKVLYVGGTPEFETMLRNDYTAEELDSSVRARMASFEAFLKTYFSSVTVIHANDYTQQLSDKYDVTVMDGVPKPVVSGYQDRAKGIYLSEGYLTEDFDRPIVTIGFISDKIGRRIGTKNDWYCLCLRSHAHRWRAEHPIFHGPFAVKMTVTDEPTPEPIYNFPHYFNGKVPARMAMWRVQTNDYNADESPRIGLVSRPGGYEDSPEAEYISSGVCDKSPDAVAIGRHGNHFHWGFAASPAHMTEEAKPVLANAIVYIAQFAGQTPIARKYNDRAATRGYAADLKQFISRDAYEMSLKATAERDKYMAELKAKAQEKQARGEALNQVDEIALASSPSPVPSYEQYLQQAGRSLYGRFGTDVPAYNRYLDENLDYFYAAAGYGLEVDEDAKSLGIANNDKRLLDQAIRLLEEGREADKARRILLRYTLVDFATPAEWRTWYDNYQDRLFFTESGGWVFLVNSREPGVNDYKAFQERRSARNITVGATTDEEPVAVAAGVVVMQDGSRLLHIRFDMHPGYHIYGHVSKSDTYLPTEIEVTLPAGYHATGTLRKPAAGYYNRSGTTVYKASAVFSQAFAGAGAGELKCKVTYQCCDANICFPPVTKELTVEVK